MVYKLVNDINFEGYEWNCNTFFNGVLDGNGYSIKNLSIKETFIYNYVSIGLFSSGEGIIRNLNFKNINFDIIVSIKRLT